ncbi:2852_t:CDS:2 [Scutellospora calospora]|uniref:2852_t:CDS:1 n=1 Tax=Scutellospora calospora TaxID=85575 RepID=A0ACA9JU00_9GLOM|nr:2852_t:CDS:2 [Scutellospora calospora]
MIFDDTILNQLSTYDESYNSDKESENFLESEILLELEISLELKTSLEPEIFSEPENLSEQETLLEPKNSLEQETPLEQESLLDFENSSQPENSLFQQDNNHSDSVHYTQLFTCNRYEDDKYYISQVDLNHNHFLIPVQLMRMSPTSREIPMNIKKEILLSKRAVISTLQI